MAPVNLYGRDAEIEVIDCCLETAREGDFCGLQLVGAPGVGKTALCDRAAELAAGFRIIRARGVETEEHLPLAALSGLLTRLQDPGPVSTKSAGAGIQRMRDVLSGGDPLALGAFVLDLLSQAAEHQPLLLLLDDWHWFDGASGEAMSFAFARLDADPIAVLMAERAGACAVVSIPRVPPLVLGDLPAAAARRLLEDELKDLAPEVAAEVIAATGANPLAVKEVAKTLTEGERSGLVRLHEPVEIGARLSGYYRHRLEPLSPDSKLALATVAASGSAPELVEPALRDLRLTLRHLEAAETLDVITVGEPGVWEFRHPLLRTAALGVLPPHLRRRVHQALASAAAGDFPRYALHLSAAAVGPSQEVGDALAEAARQAERLGGQSMAAGILERAAELTPAGELRARRFLAAAKAALLSGAGTRVAPLLDHVFGAVPGSDLAAEAALVGAQAMLWSDIGKAVEQALSAGRRLASTRPQIAVDGLALGAMGLITRGEHVAAARVGQEAVRLARSRGAEDLAVRGALAGAEVLRRHRAEAERLLKPEVVRRGLTLPRRPGFDLARDSTLAYLAQALRWCDRHDEAEALASALAEHRRRQFAPYALPYPLCVLCDVLWWNGRWAEARSAGEEGLELAEQTRQSVLAGFIRGYLARLWAARGDLARADRHATAAIGIASESGIKPLLLFGLCAQGLGRLANGSADEAAHLLLRADGVSCEMGLGDDAPMPYVADLVEALIRCGERREAELRLNDYLGPATRHGGRYRLASGLRCRAMLTGGWAADELFRNALAANAEVRFEEARIRFCWGEHLRRLRRFPEARHQLELAVRGFQVLGAGSYAQRAQEELEPLGVRVNTARAGGVDELTSRELQVALAVAEGRSNRDIAARLFISQKTVEYHLGKVFMKLGVNSRTQLVMLLPQILPNSSDWPTVPA